MELYEKLRALNPHLKMYSVTDEAFAPFGRVLEGHDTAALHAALESCPIPEEGNSYVASLSELEALDISARFSRDVFGEMEIQCGYCNGHGFTLNALEYHRCAEINYSTGGLVLLLALPEAVKGKNLDSADVAAFYLPAGVAVEIYPRVLHFAPCRISEEGFRCLVVLEKGTNAPLSHIDTAADGEAGLLWMKNKWMLCHAESPQAQKGAWIGIRGENLKVNI